MTIRKFNYTGRKKLLRDDFDLTLMAVDGSYALSVDARLDSYEFPDDAVLVCEAYERSRFERFDLGAIGAVTFPAERPLSLFAGEDAVKFRLKVIGTGALDGKLLGEHDQIVPELAVAGVGGRLTILRTEASDLGDKVWELDLDDVPLLRMNVKLGDWRRLATSQEFAFMVYPLIVEAVLKHVVLTMRLTPDSDLSRWEQLWLAFGLRTSGVPEFPTSPGHQDAFLIDWIDAVTSGFARHHGTLGKAITFCAGDA